MFRSSVGPRARVSLAPSSGTFAVPACHARWHAEFVTSLRRPMCTVDLLGDRQPRPMPRGCDCLAIEIYLELLG